MATKTAAAKPKRQKTTRRAARGLKRPFRFYDNRQKYLAFVNTCDEKWKVAERAAQELAARERKRPGDNLTRTLLDAEVEGRKLTEMEFNTFFMFLIVAGNETTRTAMSGGLATLLEHPDQLEALRKDPSLIENAVEEMCATGRRSITSGTAVRRSA